MPFCCTMLARCPAKWSVLVCAGMCLECFGAVTRERQRGSASWVGGLRNPRCWRRRKCRCSEEGTTSPAEVEGASRCITDDSSIPATCIQQTPTHSSGCPASSITIWNHDGIRIYKPGTSELGLASRHRTESTLLEWSSILRKQPARGRRNLCANLSAPITSSSPPPAASNKH